MLLPTTKHLYLAGNEKVIHAGWMGSNKVKKGVPVYFLLTRSALTCYTQKSIQKGKNKVILRIITGSIGAETISRSKQGYKLTFSGKETTTSSPRYVDLQNEEPSMVMEWYFVLVSLWEPLPGVVKYNPLPKDMVVPDRLKHYLTKPPFAPAMPQPPVSKIPLNPQPIIAPQPMVPGPYGRQVYPQKGVGYMPMMAMQPMPAPMVVQTVPVRPGPMPTGYCQIPPCPPPPPAPMGPNGPQMAPPGTIEYPHF